MDRKLIPLVARRFKVLGDARRLALLSALQSGERMVGDLAEATGRPQPNVSQHLASLARAGLVDSRREGNRVFYRIADPFVLRVCDAVCDSLAAPRGGKKRRQAAAKHSRKGRAGGEQ